jgi:two-component system CheB/CheR fusion protein
VSATNDIITKSDDQTAGLRAILERELNPYGRTRITLHGAHVQLNAELARSFSLIVHELATNAAKYGALCKPDGELRVEWALQGERLWLRWSEKNGPAIDKPFAPGFGARLVTRLLRSHGGEVTPEFTADGLSVQIALALPADTHPPQHRRPIAHQASPLL